MVHLKCVCHTTFHLNITNTAILYSVVLCLLILDMVLLAHIRPVPGGCATTFPPYAGLGLITCSLFPFSAVAGIPAAGTLRHVEPARLDGYLTPRRARILAYAATFCLIGARLRATLRCPTPHTFAAG